MSHQFQVISGPDVGKSFTLNDGQSLTIGRGQASDTQLGDPHMSRVHCRVVREGETVKLSDAGSSAGTLVDGNPIECVTLRNGLVFRIGETEIRYQSGDLRDNATLAGKPGAARSPIPSNVPALTELVGKKFGSYRIDEIITGTPSGMVFKAHDEEHDRAVAMKVLMPDFANSDEQRERFVRAMKTMLPIRDEHIVRLYGAGKNGPFCWAAMEFIEGENLTQVIDRIGIEGMLDWRDAWRVAWDVGRALAVAEQHNIIHRNVTPTNILRRSSDKACLLGDLVLAKALEGTLAKAVTQPGQLVGDVPYMSPERTRGTEAIDARSDLYGLGATCYALLTGRPPFQNDSLPLLIKSVRDEEPQPPRDFQMSINDLFQDVVLKLLAKVPDNRYQSAASMLKELERIGKFNSLPLD